VVILAKNAGEGFSTPHRWDDATKSTGNARSLTIRSAVLGWFPAMPIRRPCGTWLARAQRFAATSAYTHRTKRSAVCADCGTSLYSCAAENPTAVVVRLGCVTQRAQLKPVVQYWHRSAMPWLEELGAIPAVAQSLTAPIAETADGARLSYDPTTPTRRG